MREAVRGACHPQQWHYAIMLTPQAQVTQYPKIWAKGGYNC